jgi:L-alanine-DL-glutamate epimerase-like enolase superfamily enzyme
VMRALSVIDIALWDLNARSVGLPLYQYLGANVMDRVPAYASGGYYWPGKTPDKLADEVRAFVDEGFDAVKIKIGRLSPAAEEERVAAAREAAGRDVHLMLDANTVWKDLASAMCYMSRLEAYNPYWIEEPFPPDDIENHARLAKATRVMVVTGELEAGRWRFKELLDRGAAGLLQADATVCGGITEWRRIAATAASYGIPISPHARHDLHVHLVASTPNATYVEFFHDNTISNFQCLIDRKIVCEKGHLLLPSGPGLGFNLNPEAIARYGVTYQGETDCWAVVR